MTTPTCLGCGTKFPGDPCKKCNMPAGLTKDEAQGYRRMVLIEQGLSRREVKAAMNPHPATKNKRRKAHGRV